jgi:drug/metabolite transporter (DMT)-like permease
VLGEWPSAIDWIAISVISAGVYLLSGGPLPWAARSGSLGARMSD